jgi:hypothetical protein
MERDIKNLIVSFQAIAATNVTANMSGLKVKRSVDDCNVLSAKLSTTNFSGVVGGYG